MDHFSSNLSKYILNSNTFHLSHLRVTSVSLALRVGGKIKSKQLFFLQNHQVYSRHSPFHISCSKCFLARMPFENVKCEQQSWASSAQDSETRYEKGRPEL